MNDQESVGEGEKSSKVSVGHGNVVVVSSRGGELVVKDWRVRWPPLRGRRPRDTRSFCNGTVTLMFGNMRFYDLLTLPPRHFDFVKKWKYLSQSFFQRLALNHYFPRIFPRLT